MPVTPRVAWRHLACTLVALAVLLQAMFTLPLAVRMAAADTAQTAGALGPVGSHADHHMSHADHQMPTAPHLPHSHDHCLICHAPTAPFGALITATIFVITVSVALLVEQALSNSVPHPSSSFYAYRPRAPPALI